MIRLLRFDHHDAPELEIFGDDAIMPPYAILSHTWGDASDEVSFQDLQTGTYESKAGYRKIRFCLEQSRKNRLEYVWVDTCCINRSNSVELQEAITRMFSWYSLANICYVYLADVSVTDKEVEGRASIHHWEPSFRKSRWFTRGWTLQELIAPRSVEFFSVEGTRLCDKKSHESLIHDIVEIPLNALQGASMDTFSVTERLSWAEGRNTTRTEDKAYCLLGIFGVFMPLIYGEGDNAFTRLQKAIEKKHPEKTRVNELLFKLPFVARAAFNSLDNQHRSTCLPDTRVELLQEISGWIDGPDNRTVFWLNGTAGTGKSTVARTIARTYNDRAWLGASFFFSRGGGDVSRADRLLPTLAWQLATKVSRLKAYICDAVTEHEDIATCSLRDQWDWLIVGPLLRLNGDDISSTIVLVLDALDECDSERDIRIILNLLSTIPPFSNIRLRVLITCRPEISVRCGFLQIPEAQRQIFILHDIAAATVNQDLSLFFEHNFAIIREERGFASDWPGMQISRRLVKASGGLFIWASTACRFIREGRRLANRRIDTLLNGCYSGTGPQKHLDEIYTTVLRASIHPDYDVEERKELCEMLRFNLGSIIILFSPLSIEALSNLGRTTSSSITETLADLHTIFDIPIVKTRPIRPHHPTFRDFILDQNRCSDFDFWVDKKQAHQAMADNCVQLMSKLLKTDMCNLQSAGTHIGEVDSKLIKRHVPSELEYACRYWIQHYRESGIHLHDDGPTHLFLEENFLRWLEVMSLTGNGSEVAGLLRIYAALLESAQNLRQLRFVQDARRFVSAFISCIEITPLQVYCAALAFGPGDSKLRHQYEDQMQKWISDIKIATPVSNRVKKQRSRRTFFVNQIAFTPNGRQIASGSISGLVRLWDVATKGTLQGLRGQTDKVGAVAISTDGLLIATGSDDATVMVWELSTQTLRYTLRGHSRWVNSIAFSPNTNLLASASMDETIRVWDLARGQELYVLGNHSCCINSIAFSPDGLSIASADADQMVRVWDLARRQISLLLDGHSGMVNSVQFSTDGKWIVSGADDMTVKLWEFSTGTNYMTFRGHRRRVMAVAFRPDNRIIASGSEDTTVILWDAATGSQLGILDSHVAGINAVAFSPSDPFLVSSSSDSEVRLWNAESGKAHGNFNEFEEDDLPSVQERIVGLSPVDPIPAVEELTGHSGAITCMAASLNGRLIASGSKDATIKIWTNNGVRSWQLNGHSDIISGLLFSPDDHFLASTSTDRSMKLWDVKSGALCYTFGDHSDAVRYMCFSTEGHVLASCTMANVIVLWETTTGSMMHKLKGHLDILTNVKFSPVNEHIIASCSADSTIRLWDIVTGTASQVLSGHTDAVNSIAFSSDGRSLISCSADTTVRIWNLAGATCDVLNGHTLSVISAAFSSDGKKGASCSDDHTIRIWDLESKSVQNIMQCLLVIRSLQFSSCGQYLETDRGRLAVDDTGSPHGTDRLPPLFAQEKWITKGGVKMLWLPDDYRATHLITRADTITLGHASGGVSFIRF